MLVMYREALAARKPGRPVTDEALAFPNLTTTWTDYSQDPGELERQRLTIGDRLDKLTPKR